MNLTAGDQRYSLTSVDERVLRALAITPAQGRLFADGETNVTGHHRQAVPMLTPAIAILSHELWQSALGGRPIVGELVEINGRRLEIHPGNPTGADVMDNRTEVWLPLGLNPANRQNRGNHFLYLIGRLKTDMTATGCDGVDVARAELGRAVTCERATR